MELPYKVFKEFSGKCPDKEDWKCKLTGYACKDYMCPKARLIAMDMTASQCLEAIGGNPPMPEPDPLRVEPKQETAMEIAFKRALTKKKG